jgi:diaminopimelate epimerase
VSIPLLPKAPQKQYFAGIEEKYILRYKKSINKDKTEYMKRLDAYKMDGLGNDFIIFDKRKNYISLTKDQIVQISKRSSIGCDQVIFIENDKSNDAYLKFYNSDGSEAGACGNGSRCVAYILMKEKNNNKVSLKTKGGILHAQLNSSLVSLNIGQPKFDWQNIPLSGKMNNENLKIKILDLKGKETEGGFALSVGNPHVVFFLQNLNDFDLIKIGPEIENHNYFPEKCNVTFAKIINRKHIKVKVWERGAGLTKACGTAACATVVAAASLKLTERLTNIEFNEGLLNIDWDLNNNIHMKGEVSKIKKIEVHF